MNKRGPILAVLSRIKGQSPEQAKRVEGFTLIEVLAAMVLIVLALIPIMTIVPQMINNSIDSERLTKVVFLAQKKMEDIRRNVEYDYAGFDSTATATAFASPYGDYKYIVADDVAADIRTIQVQVWCDEDSDNTLDAGEKSITLNTKVADRNP